MVRLFPFRRARSWFAIDVGSSSIKVAEVRDARGGPGVLRIGVLPVPVGAVENGFVRRTEVLANAIREFAGPTHGKPRRAVVSIPGRGVIIKRLQLPGRNIGQLDQVIEFEAMDAIPEDLDNVNIDYHVVGPSQDGTGLEVLLIAARKTLVENYVDLLEAAGMVPAIVEVDHFALRSGIGRLGHERAGVLVHAGACSTTIHISADGSPGYTTDLPVGGEQFTESLAESLHVSRDEAEAIKCGAPSPDVDGLLDSLCHEFASRVGRSLSLFGTPGDETDRRRVSLSGGSAFLPGLGPSLARVLEAEVRVHGPVFDGCMPPESIEAGPAFAVIAGLVTRSPFE